MPNFFTIKHNSKVIETSWQGKTDKLTEKMVNTYFILFALSLVNFGDYNVQVHICKFPFQHAWVTPRDVNYIYQGEKKSLSGCPAQAVSKSWESNVLGSLVHLARVQESLLVTKLYFRQASSGCRQTKCDSRLSKGKAGIQHCFYHSSTCISFFTTM